jgi:hypothetical protein
VEARPDGTDLLYPLIIDRWREVMHLFKNAELCGLSHGFGSGVHPANGRFLPNLVCSLIYQLARLFSGSHEVRDIIRLYCLAGELLGTDAGNIVHRLMNKPTHAKMMSSFMGPILHAIAKINEALSWLTPPSCSGWARV